MPGATIPRPGPTGAADSSIATLTRRAGRGRDRGTGGRGDEGPRGRPGGGVAVDGPRRSTPGRGASGGGPRLAEDVGPIGDLTAMLVPEADTIRVRVMARADG